MQRFLQFTTGSSRLPIADASLWKMVIKKGSTGIPYLLAIFYTYMYIYIYTIYECSNFMHRSHHSKQTLHNNIIYKNGQMALYVMLWQRMLYAAICGIVYIVCSTDESQLPTAATCFNTLHLPCYTSKDVLSNKLMQAIAYGHLHFFDH